VEHTVLCAQRAFDIIAHDIRVSKRGPAHSKPCIGQADPDGAKFTVHRSLVAQRWFVRVVARARLLPSEEHPAVELGLCGRGCEFMRQIRSRTSILQEHPAVPEPLRKHSSKSTSAISVLMLHHSF
jgi:hypothetical protein